MEVYSVDFNYVILGKKDDFLNELREPYLAEKLVFTSILFFSCLLPILKRLHIGKQHKRI